MNQANIYMISPRRRNAIWFVGGICAVIMVSGNCVTSANESLGNAYLKYCELAVKPVMESYYDISYVMWSEHLKKEGMASAHLMYSRTGKDGLLVRRYSKFSSVIYGAMMEVPEWSDNSTNGVLVGNRDYQGDLKRNEEKYAANSVRVRSKEEMIDIGTEVVFGVPYYGTFPWMVKQKNANVIRWDEDQDRCYLEMKVPGLVNRVAKERPLDFEISAVYDRKRGICLEHSHTRPSDIDGTPITFSNRMDYESGSSIWLKEVSFLVTETKYQERTLYKFLENKTPLTDSECRLSAFGLAEPFKKRKGIPWAVLIMVIGGLSVACGLYLRRHLQSKAN